jgi:hypothetical protein
MEKETNQSHGSDVEQRIDDLREGITGADATGLIAGEQLITQAETLLPVSQRIALPSEELHNALPHGHAAHGTIDALDAELTSDRPNAAAIQEHAGALGAFPELRDRFVTWWEDPRVQRFISDLGQIGV